MSYDVYKCCYVHAVELELLEETAAAGQQQMKSSS